MKRTSFSCSRIITIKSLLAAGCLLFVSLCSKAQLKLSLAGAMSALNSDPVPVSPPPSVLNFGSVPISAAPVIPSVSTRPIGFLQRAISVPPANDRALWFTYRSPLSWWSGDFDYRTAAQNLDFTSFQQALQTATATEYLLSTTNFTPFESYPGPRTTMIVRANDLTPVQFLQTQIINNGAVELKEYAPKVSVFYLEIPLDFTYHPVIH